MTYLLCQTSSEATYSGAVVPDKAPDKVLCSPVEGSQPMQTLVLIDNTEVALWQKKMRNYYLGGEKKSQHYIIRAPEICFSVSCLDYASCSHFQFSLSAVSIISMEVHTSLLITMAFIAGR